MRIEIFRKFCAEFKFKRLYHSTQIHDMQIYAIDSDGQLFTAAQSIKKTDYFCLECQQIVRLRGGPHRQSHFYHLDPTPLCRQHQKGIIHLQIQTHFYKELPIGDCRLEYHFPDIKRIADVAWLSKKIVFEIQYSAISAEEILERNLDYAKCGWQVVWILHEHRYNQTRISSAEMALRLSPHYFTNINHLGKGIIYDQFDRWEAGLRKERLKPLPIDFCFIEELSGKPLLGATSLIKDRSIHWPISFKNDLLYLCLNNLHSDYLKESVKKEAKEALLLNRNKTPKKWISLFIRSIFNLYQNVFRYLLENSCH